MFTNIGECKKWLDQRLIPNGNDYHRKMLETVKLLGQRQYLSTFLKLVIGSSEYLHLIALESYVHYNGFDKIVLVSSTNPQYKLRLHVWWPRTDKLVSTENVHNHRWDFSSIIIIGSYRDQKFQLSDIGEEMYEYRYFSPEGQDHYSMEFKGINRLRCVHDRMMSTGYCYTLPHSVLHRIVSDRQKLTATLMLQGPVVKSSVINVFSYQKIHNPDMIDSSPFSASDISQKIENLLTVLECMNN